MNEAIDASEKFYIFISLKHVIIGQKNTKQYQ